MGQMIECDEGHWFDKSQNTMCPFCDVRNVDPTRKFDAGKAAAPAPEAAVTDDEAAETVMYRGRAAGAETPRASEDVDEATRAVWAKDSGFDPVVGWLACIDGMNKGRDYRIRSGYNVIGRDTRSQICIAGDTTISRENHAKLFFDPRNATFHVISGEGRSGIYVNGQVVLQSSVLNAYDVLEVGSTKLVFVPLCGDRFRWDGASR